MSHAVTVIKCNILICIYTVCSHLSVQILKFRMEVWSNQTPSEVLNPLLSKPRSAPTNLQQSQDNTFKSVTLANTRLVKASPTDILAPAAGSISPFIGCSPIAVAEPTFSRYESAVTATSANGVWSGPTHCCWATRPVTHLSTWNTCISACMYKYQHIHSSR